MTVQWAVGIRNALLDQWETTIGVSAKIAVYTGTMPANAAADTTGTLLCEWDLASDWAANASAGAKALNSTPIAATAAGTGTVGYYRIFANAQSTAPGTTKPCNEQGTVTATGGGGDMTIDNTSIASGQTVNITGFTKTAPGA